MKLLVRFLFSLILIHPAITFSENKYSGNFQIKYGVVDFHKTDTSIFNDDEAPNYKPFSLQAWIAKKYTSEIDIFLMGKIATYNTHGT